MITNILLTLAGIGMGSVATWFFMRKSTDPSFKALCPPDVSWPQSFPPLKQKTQIWLVPDLDSQLEVSQALARSLSDYGSVLLINTLKSKHILIDTLKGKGRIYSLEKDRPDSEPILKVASLLQPAGPVFIIVEGFDALESPAPDEPADAVAEELIELCEETDAVLLIILKELDRFPKTPDIRIIRQNNGLAIGDKVVIKDAKLT